ncbi:inositol monophosphatase [Candidatus Bipolaricaulota bacterium]|nr:inositol monophosphatase [Candidatus Bipolaricaulota bacterium]
MPHPAALSKRLDVAVDAARTAGGILYAGFQAGAIDYETKSHRNDVVTALDLRADQAIIEILRSSFPEDGILTEESGQMGDSLNGQWVIDPLDGSSNYAQNIPHFATSIAFCLQDVPLIACIHDPMRNETFTAVRGAGAALNGRALHTSDQQQLEGAFLCAGTSIHPDLRLRFHQLMPPFLQTARALRTTGSAALDLAYVAAGRFDAAWYPQLSWWDVAAGILLIEEAGGYSSDLCGCAFAGPTSSILASNGPLHDTILYWLKRE